MKKHPKCSFEDQTPITKILLFCWPSHWPIILTSGILSDLGLSRVHLPHQDRTQVFQFQTVDDILLLLLHLTFLVLSGYSKYSSRQLVAKWSKLNLSTQHLDKTQAPERILKSHQGLSKASRRLAISGSFSWYSGFSLNASDHLKYCTCDQVNILWQWKGTFRKPALY